MKKFLMLIVIAGSMQLAQAQDLKKVQTAYMINKMEDAKTEIDKVMADPKQNTKPEAMYWKAKVYAAVYKKAADKPIKTGMSKTDVEKILGRPTNVSKTTTQSDYFELYDYPKIQVGFSNDGRVSYIHELNNAISNSASKELQEADEAFKKYSDADPAFAQVKEKGAEGFFDMYATSYANGVKLFNDKKWEDAASNFKYAVEYSDFIFKNKWSNATIAFDTTSILYLAYAYQNASKMNDAAKYYSRLADAKVAADMYIDIYKFLANHYTVFKNEELFKKYLGLGKELYPKYAWDEFEIDYMDQNMNLAEKTALYDKEDAAGTLSEVKYLQFADIFVNAHNKDKNMDSATENMYNLKAVDAYKKAYGKNAQNAIAAFNVGVVYYNLFGGYDDAFAQNIRTMQGINADRPVEKDPKKKAAAEAALKAKLDPIRKANADIEKPLNDNLNMSLEWLEKAYVILKDKATRTNTEKSVINKAVDFLANLYAYKRDKVRGKDLKAFDAFEAKYKEFDALHGKY